MTIKEVCRAYHISADTLRFYERAGVIPRVNRSARGNRDYTPGDLEWVENAVCMRNAGMSIEVLAEYVRLSQEGDSTMEARRDLLLQTKAEVQEQLDRNLAAMERLNYKLSRYEEAIKTGVLTWE